MSIFFTSLPITAWAEDACAKEKATSVVLNEEVAHLRNVAASLLVDRDTTLTKLNQALSEISELKKPTELEIKN